MQTADPTSRLNRKNNIWNVVIIDNIDFKQKRFQYGNIYDVTRESVHATLRMTFQTGLPETLSVKEEEIVELTKNTPIFEMNETIKNRLRIFDQIIKELLDC